MFLMKNIFNNNDDQKISNFVLKKFSYESLD